MCAAQAAQAYDETLDRSSLHYAASRGQLLVLHALLTRGDCVNTLTIDGITPLHDACSTGHVYCARKLISSGAWINPQEYHEGRTPLFEASMNGHIECVKVLLESGGQTNPQQANSTPLHEAAMH
ncbi:ankyrin repeat and SOCS box protein 13-like, partial [Anneissia japonica]|uniref:ankyrin repeat and SOCS box protein 13-like n=1 Tax=Anneissia japonica TaxID=1529436 RepID=UPI0014257F2D